MGKVKSKVKVVTFTVEGLTIALIDGTPHGAESRAITPVINGNRVVLHRDEAGRYNVIKDNIGIGRTLIVADVEVTS